MLLFLQILLIGIQFFLAISHRLSARSQCCIVVDNRSWKDFVFNIILSNYYVKMMPDILSFSSPEILFEMLKYRVQITDTDSDQVEFSNL